MAAALLLVFAVRIWVFSIYSVPADNLIKGWKQGDRVMVNRLVSAPLKRGDKIIYTDSVYDYMAQIQAIPGDTITLKCGRFLIPEVCCQRCGCPDCKYYLVRVGNKQQLIHKHLIVGKANRLFHLPF
ncbi:MAG: signal peptidase [Prevotella sp.]|jgi:signal peptidase I|nr:signal peptidase [Prevotella sp.]